MAFKVFQYSGIFLVFFGLMLIFTPHFILHTHPNGTHSNELEDPLEHIYIFTLPGMIPTLLGIYLLNQYDKKTIPKAKNRPPIK